MNIKVTVIDDDPNDCQKIASFLSAYNNQDHILIISAFSSFRECNTHDDLYILDIDMPDINGFEACRIISKENPDAKIIFCTNHAELVFDSYELNTFYYVRKEELESDLTKAIRKYLKLTDMNVYRFSKTQTPQYLRLNHIIYFQTDGNDILIHTDDSLQNYHDHCSLKSVEESLQQTAFFKISSSFIINLDYFSHMDGKTVYLKDGSKISISRSKVKEFREVCNAHILDTL
jgi:DNA-binding LytR/AlgR family response regulator